MNILNSLIGPVTGLLDKVIQDKDQKAMLAHQIATMAERHGQELAQAQLEVNKTEAAHKNLFVAGWRPAVGWVCVLGMAGNFIIIPMANFGLALGGSGIEVPMIETAEMLPVLMGMLGLGTLRTVEKTKKVQRDK